MAVVDKAGVRKDAHPGQPVFELIFGNGIGAGTEEAVEKMELRHVANADFPYCRRPVALSGLLCYFWIHQIAAVALLPQFGVTQTPELEGGCLAVVEKDGGGRVGALVSHQRQVWPVHALDRLGVAAAVGDDFEVFVYPPSIPEEFQRKIPPPQAEMAAGMDGEVHPGCRVARVDHAVVFGPVVGQSSEGGARQPAHGRVSQGGFVPGVLRRGAGGEHPAAAQRFPGFGFRVIFEEEMGGDQTFGGPRVFLHLRIGIDAAAGGHGAEAVGVVGLDAGDHRPGFRVDPVAQEQGDGGQRGGGAAALAFAEESPSAFAPFGAEVARIAPSGIRPDAVFGAGVVGEAEIADRFDGHLLELVSGDVGGLFVEFVRGAGHGQGKCRADGLQAVPVAAAEKVAAVGAFGPFGEGVGAGAHPLFDHSQVAAAQVVLLCRELRLAAGGVFFGNHRRSLVRRSREVSQTGRRFAEQHILGSKQIAGNIGSARTGGKDRCASLCIGCIRGDEHIN